MPRRAASSTHQLARVRAWFGLTRPELALYLGVSDDLVGLIEAGRRRLTAPGQVALLPLLLQLPPPEAQAAALAQAARAEAAPAPAPAPPAPPPLAAPPDALALRDRRLDCLAQAARLRTQAARLGQQARAAAHWAAALPALLPPDPDAPAAPAAPADPADPAAQALAAALAQRLAPLPHDPAPPDPARPAAFARWLRGWLHWRARPLPPDAATRYCRLLARAAGLDAEAAALAGHEGEGGMGG